jgi:glycosyltransferase involved in cell wall biosynthesis
VRSLRVLMLASSYPKWPGEPTAPFIEEIAAGLVQRGHTIHVALPYHPELRRLPIERGVHLHPFRYALHPALNVWGYAAALKADVGLKGAALAAAPLALGASLWSLLQHSQRDSIDLIHAHWMLPNGLPAMLAARMRKLPLVTSLHGSDVFIAEKAAPFALAARTVLRASRAVSACSSDLHQRALRLGAPPARSHTVPYGVDTTAFKPYPAARQRVRSKLGVDAETPVILSISRLVYKKGLTFLIDSLPKVLEQHGTAILVLAGYGDLREVLEQRARELGVAAHVRFPGQLSREQAAAYFGAADVYAVPSIHDQAGNVDGLPNVLLEAMSAGCPIVASAIAGIPDVITDRVHGRLVPEQDAVALAEAMNELLSNRPYARSLGMQARQRILEELTWDATARHFEELYQQALG